MKVASDASGALDEVSGGNCDLVVSDIVMPGMMNGASLASAIRELRRDLPVLLVTGYSDAAKEASTRFPVIRKPSRLVK